MLLPDGSSSYGGTRHYSTSSSGTLLLEDMGSADGQRKAAMRLADYPKRVERLKRLWIDVNGGGRMPPSRLACAGAAAIGGSGTLQHLRGGAGAHGMGRGGRTSSYGSGQGMAGALTMAQIRDLMTRELTPEDYELLLLLDEGMKKARTLSAGAALTLPRASSSASNGEACGVCLCEFDDDEDVRLLPACSHMYHASCIERWLTGSKASCPLCGTEV
eukprot:gnl/TRDRNA2_/TRDRNA2_91951_c0_seq1.p1 gnl/TRDRNA2_/TRDRNA2_91951_c0~~gnl/TRDRNA2_/TRDRNA2_91951_c0_seq1.p1  ORF type:complete len:217 (-),score=41.92 gnl/TRDRNA2_/TRDRNA2_91951_c0_seq1:147-797(-)